MTNSLKPDAFEQLKKHWYKKLKDTGFRDIEFSEESPYLIDDYMRSAKAVTRSNLKSIAEHYRLASEFYWIHTFKRKYDKLVWQLYVEGKTERETVRILSKSRYKHYRTSRYPVHESIVKTKEAMITWINRRENNAQEHPEER